MDRDNALKYSNSLLTHTFYSINFLFRDPQLSMFFLILLKRRVSVTYNSLQAKLLDVPAVEESLSWEWQLLRWSTYSLNFWGWTQYWTFRFRKSRANSWSAKRLLVSDEGLCTTKIVMFWIPIRGGVNTTAAGIEANFIRRFRHIFLSENHQLPRFLNEMAW